MLLAQTATPVTLQSVTLSGAAAKRALTKTEINLETAEKIVATCIDYAKARNSGASVVVLSSSGSIVVAKRTDGQTPNNVDSAYQKAKTALYMRASTHEVLNRWSTAEAQVARSNLDLYLVIGGLPIIVDDQLIGSVGVGGASGDEPCALEALSGTLALSRRWLPFRRQPAPVPLPRQWRQRAEHSIALTLTFEAQLTVSCGGSPTTL